MKCLYDLLAIEIQSDAFIFYTILSICNNGCHILDEEVVTLLMTLTFSPYCIFFKLLKLGEGMAWL